MSKIGKAMNTFEDYDLTFLGEPVHVAAKVKSGFRNGVIALTESRLVFIRKKKDREFVDHEHHLHAISTSGLKKFLGTWQLSVDHNGKSEIFVGQQDELEPFVKPLLRSAEAQVGQADAVLKENPEAYLSTPEKNEVDGRAIEYDGHDISIAGEPPLLVAKASAGIRNGVIVLTETRLIYLRKKGSVTFVDRQSDRRSITDVKYTKLLKNRHLEFNDGLKPVIYYERDDDLNPFVELLQISVNADEPKGAGMQDQEESIAGPEVHRERDDADTYKGHDLTVVGEPVLLIAKVSGGWRTGVIVLTETRLVYLREKNGETHIDRDTNRAAITDFDPKPMSGNVALRFKDGGSNVSYFHDADDLDPFIKPLQASANANEAKRNEAKDARLAGIICSARGRNGQVFLFEDRVLITREGFMSFLSYGFRGDKEILIREITSIGWREPGNFTTGYIHFGYRGGQMPVRTSVFDDDSIVNNEDAVLFTDEHQRDFETFRRLLEERRAEMSRPEVIVSSGLSQMDELKKLAELKEMGIVTEDEFEQKKKQLLGI